MHKGVELERHVLHPIKVGKPGIMTEAWFGLLYRQW